MYVGLEHAMQSWSPEDIFSGLAAIELEVAPLNFPPSTYHYIYYSQRELIHEPLLKHITRPTLDTIDDILPLPSFVFVTAIYQGAFRWAAGP